MVMNNNQFVVTLCNNNKLISIKTFIYFSITERNEPYFMPSKEISLNLGELLQHAQFIFIFFFEEGIMYLKKNMK